jgi:hypothetical protein
MPTPPRDPIADLALRICEPVYHAYFDQRTRLNRGE